VHLEFFVKQGVMDIYYFDESGFSLAPNLPYAWSAVGKTLSVLVPKSKKERNLFIISFCENY